MAPRRAPSRGTAPRGGDAGTAGRFSDEEAGFLGGAGGGAGFLGGTRGGTGFLEGREAASAFSAAAIAAKVSGLTVEPDPLLSDGGDTTFGGGAAAFTGSTRTSAGIDFPSARSPLNRVRALASNTSAGTT